MDEFGVWNYLSFAFHCKIVAMMDERSSPEQLQSNTGVL